MPSDDEVLVSLLLGLMTIDELEELIAEIAARTASETESP